MTTSLGSKIGWWGGGNGSTTSTIVAMTSEKIDSRLYLGQWLICAMDLAIFRLITNVFTIM